MSLHLIVDGYNLIRTSPVLSDQEKCGLESGRQSLLARLSAYRFSKPWPVTVVFDAAEARHLATNTRMTNGIRVIYSPMGVSADEVIIRLVEEEGAKAVVVTSDKQLDRSVTALGAVTIDSDEFESKMEQSLTSEYQMFDDPDDEPPFSFSSKKKGPSRRPARSRRRKSARLKKL